MQLCEIARRLPPEVWRMFEPILPPVIWKGNGRPPVSNERVLHALLYVLISGISWEMLPWPAFPSAKTVKRRVRVWSQMQVFLQTWTRLAAQYDRLVGINWDQLCIDGSRRPSKKGARQRVRVPLIAVNAART